MAKVRRVAGGARAASEVHKSEKKKDKASAGTAKYKGGGKGGRVSRSAVTGRDGNIVTDARHPQTTVVEIGGLLGHEQALPNPPGPARTRVAPAVPVSATQRQATPPTGVSQAQLDRVLVEV